MRAFRKTTAVGTLRVMMYLLVMVSAIGLLAQLDYCACGPNCSALMPDHQDSIGKTRADPGCSCRCEPESNAPAKDCPEHADGCCGQCSLQREVDPIALYVPGSPRTSRTAAQAAIVYRKCISSLPWGHALPTVVNHARPRGSPTYLQLEILLI